MKTTKQFNDLCKVILNILKHSDVNLDEQQWKELLEAMFPPSPERERDIDPGLLEHETTAKEDFAKGGICFEPRTAGGEVRDILPDEYSPDPEHWVECIAECPTMNIVFGKDYRVYGSTQDNYVIFHKEGEFEVIAKNYFKPKP